MSEQKLYEVRKFLNRKGFHSTAFIFASLLKNITKGRIMKTGKRQKDYVWYETELKISDCDRMINLSVDTHNKRDVKNTLRKLDILINILKEFRNILSKEMNNHFKNKKGDV